MTMVWEDPTPTERGFGGVNKPKSQTRLEAEAFSAQLLQYPGKWARLWSEPEEVDARRKEQVLRGCVDKGTLKVVVRRTEQGYSVFAMAKEPKLTEPQGQQAQAVQHETREAQLGDGQGQGTFQ